MLTWDKDGSGGIDRNEFAQMFPNENPQQVSEAFNQLDLDNNNQLEFSEFIAMMLNYKSAIDKARFIPLAF